MENYIKIIIILAILSIGLYIMGDKKNKKEHLTSCTV